MQSAQTNVFARDDTFFGVCEAIGEDFGFNPNVLRVALAVLLFVNPVAVIGGYAAAGVVVALSRWLVPNPRSAVADQPVGEPGAEHAPAGNDANAEPLAAAA